MRVLGMFFGGLGTERLAFGSELMAPAPAPSRTPVASSPDVAEPVLREAPAAPLAPGRLAERNTRFAAADLNAMLELIGPQAAGGLIEGLLASHLLGCAVANAAEAAPSHAVITLNHRVMCKCTAAAETDIHIASRALRADWNPGLKGWVAELEAEATSAGQLLMSSLITLLVKPPTA